MLTQDQYNTLKANILADATLADKVASADDIGIAAAYNLPASPDYWVWRTQVPLAEVYGVTTADNTVWSWTAYIARSQAERDAWREMFAGASGFSFPNVNAAKVNVRQGIADIFSGTASGAPAQRTHLLTVARRLATRYEKVFSTGSGTTNSPSVMTLEGALSYADVSIALRG